jgi:hypothetical protein
MSFRRRVRRSSLVLAMALAVTLTFGAASASAVTTNFTGSSNSDWTNAANWSAGVPGAGDYATFTGYQMTCMMFGQMCNPAVTNVPTTTIAGISVYNNSVYTQLSMTGQTGAVLTVTDTAQITVGTYNSVGFNLPNAGSSFFSGTFQNGVTTVAAGHTLTAGGNWLGAGTRIDVSGELIADYTQVNDATIALHGAGHVQVNASTQLTMSTGSVLDGSAGTAAAQTTGTGAIALIGATIRNVAFGSDTEVDVAATGGTIPAGTHSSFAGYSRLQGVLTLGIGASVTNSGMFDLYNGGLTSADPSNRGSFLNSGVTELFTAWTGTLRVDTDSTGKLSVGNGTLDATGSNVHIAAAGSGLALTGGHIDVGQLTLDADLYGAKANGEVAAGASGRIVGPVVVDAGHSVYVAASSATSGLFLQTATFLPGSGITAYVTSADVYSRLRASESGSTSVAVPMTIRLTGTYTPPVGTSFAMLANYAQDGGAAPVRVSTVNDSLADPAAYFRQTVAANERVFTVTRTVAVVGSRATYPGDSIPVSGTGFIPGETVRVRLEVVEDGIVAQTDLVADGLGAISGAIVVPATQPPGLVTVTTEGLSSYTTTRTDRSVSAPVSGTTGGGASTGTGSTSTTTTTTSTTPASDPDPDGDGLANSVDCDDDNGSRPAQGAGVVDANCDGVNDAFAPLVLNGGKAADNLAGGPGADRLNGGSGNDRLNGRGGNDRLFGGFGADTILGGDGTDVGFGGAGNDGLAGGNGADQLYGEPGNDRIAGGLGRDQLSGGLGSDVLLARDGARDVLSCGPGIDTAYADRYDVIARDCEHVFVR